MRHGVSLIFVQSGDSEVKHLKQRSQPILLHGLSGLGRKLQWRKVRKLHPPSFKFKLVQETGLNERPVCMTVCEHRHSGIAEWKVSESCHPTLKTNQKPKPQPPNLGAEYLVPDDHGSQTFTAREPQKGKPQSK